MAAATKADGSWGDVMADGRLPRFILICLGVWISAADSLVTATIMPSVGADLGGYAYFGWATAGFLLGSVLAGASSGLLALRFGLRRATAAAALLYAVGCALSAAGPDIWSFLIGRLLQGMGGGWVVGFCSVAIGLLFPDRLLPRVYAAITAVWGVASLLGPMIGGIFADLGAWRWVFWLFAIQALGVAWAAFVMLPRGDQNQADSRVAWPQLTLIAAGVSAIGLADMAHDFARSAALIALGIALLAAMVWVDGRSAVRLLPKGTGNLRSIAGAGLATMFLLTTASMGFSIYGPAILQTLAGFSALAAGYVIAGEAAAWTVLGLIVAHLTGAWPVRMIRLGAVVATLGVLLSALVFPSGSVLGVIVAGLFLGGGFGLAWAFMSQRILAALPLEERAIGAAAMTTVRLTGAAVGAAAAGAVANLVGFSEGLSEVTAKAAGLWVFVSILPVAMLGVWTAWRLTAERT
ncbi:MAG: MFS transporter [Pseudomonadota bacterium]|uniref:MFS transporter n=1 Tax=Phenylobacterium sp. TaxID=1871053 RepID=UPI00271B5E94|nr:MFS transporter [Phenylobacterium sp.]MDO9431498.1 MFS transporter [Phenylobacterium sp.]